MIKELDDFDFGFSAVTESELESIKALQEKASQTESIAEINTQKLQQIEKMIIPFVDKLMADSDKEYIYWPDRKKKLNLFRKALIEIIRG